MLSEYKRDSVEKLFLSFKLFASGGPLMDHGTEKLRGDVHEPNQAAIRLRMLQDMGYPVS